MVTNFCGGANGFRAVWARDKSNIRRRFFGCEITSECADYQGYEERDYASQRVHGVSGGNCSFFSGTWSIGQKWGMSLHHVAEWASFEGENWPWEIRCWIFSLVRLPHTALLSRDRRRALGPITFGHRKPVRWLSDSSRFNPSQRMQRRRMRRQWRRAESVPTTFP